MSHLNKNKAPSPDTLSNWVLKEYAEVLAHAVHYILDPRIKSENYPKMKQVIYPKRELRPISLTSTLAKISEDFVIFDYMKSALESLANPN